MYGDLPLTCHALCRHRKSFVQAMQVEIVPTGSVLSTGDVICWGHACGCVKTQKLATCVPFFPFSLSILWPGLDLREQERYWRLLRAGRGKEYHGRAVHPRHISWYERFVLGLHKQYDPKLDAEARLAEMKVVITSLCPG